MKVKTVSLGNVFAEICLKLHKVDIGDGTRNLKRSVTSHHFLTSSIIYGYLSHRTEKRFSLS